MYGRIHYENEAGEFRVLDCRSQDVYDRELKIACRWIESEPRRPLGIWGERLQQSGPFGIGRDYTANSSIQAKKDAHT